MDSDEEVSCDELGRPDPTGKNRGGEAGITLGTGIGVAVYIAMSEVLHIVSRKAVMNDGWSHAT